MAQSDYAYALCLYHNDGTPLGQVPVDVDWEPGLQWAHLEAVRRGTLPAEAAVADGEVRPLWAAEADKPRVDRLRLSLRDPGGREAALELAASPYFTIAARQASACFVERGDLAAGDLFRYTVTAWPAERPPKAASTLNIEQMRPPLPLREEALEGLLDSAGPEGQIASMDLPVLLPEAVRAQAAGLARRAGAVETGGILIGHLCRDPRTRALFCRVTAQVPARHTRSELTSLTFTAETWSSVRQAIELRRCGEIMLGWWHSHSFLKESCRDCRKKADGSCRASAAFLSDTDCTLHRACFPRAYSLALVVAESPCAGLEYALFGWREGILRRRGRHVIGEPTCEVKTAGNNEGAGHVAEC